MLPASGRFGGPEESAGFPREPVDAAGQAFQESKGEERGNKEPSPGAWLGTLIIRHEYVFPLRVFLLCFREASYSQPPKIPPADECLGCDTLESSFPLTFCQ